MANPNIVSVTSIYGESIGEALTTTVTTDIMTVATDKLVKINYISVANDHASTAVVVTVFNLLQALHSFFAENATAQPVNSISGVDDDSIVFQNIHDLLNESSLRIYWINTQKHVK